MANLSRTPRSGDDRGQLILVTGLTLAVALVILVLLVNTAIFTQNLATRDADVGEDDALAYEDAVREGIGGIVDRENGYYNQTGYDNRTHLESNVTNGIRTYDRNLSNAYLDRAVAANINRSTIVYHNGSLVRQTNASRNFSSQSGTSDWMVASNISDTRKFRITIKKGQLLDGVLSNSFQIVLDNGSEVWKAVIRKDTTATPTEIEVAVQNASESSPSVVCTTTTDPATIDLTDGTVAGDPCPGLEWAKGLSGRYDVRYVNGQYAEGTYNMTLNVSTTGASVNATNLNSGPGGPSPYFVPAVYDVTVNISYQSGRLEYRKRIRIAPGESDD